MADNADPVTYGDVKAINTGLTSNDHGSEVEHVRVQKPRVKPFTVWSAMAMGYSISNSGVGMVLVVGNAVFGAGPLFIYGTLVVGFVAFCVAITLGELSSAYPHAGGQYFWVAQLCPERYRRFASYMTAIISWAAVICLAASTCSAIAQQVFTLVVLTRPDFEYKQWMGFLVFIAANCTGTAMVFYERILPIMSNTFLAISVGGIVAIFICLLAPNTDKAPASLVFGTEGYYNLSGWPNGVAFLIGISGINWGFSCLDAATHLAEEIPEPRKNIPMALLCTVAIGFMVAFPINVAVFFKAPDLENATSLTQILYTAYRNNAAPAIAFGCFLIVSLWGSLVGIHTWQARIAWSLSRDKGFPFHSRLSQLAPAPLHTPAWAIVWSSCWVTLCAFLYLGSTTAFNSFISAGIILQYMSYAVPTVLLLIKGRKHLAKGPFWWPRFGLVANIVVIVWTLMVTVFYSFPLFKAVEASNMNYLACVLVVVFLYALIYWVAYGRKHYRLVDLALILE